MLLSAVGEYCSAGWPEHFPSHPPTLADADPACYDAKSRLERLDDYGVWAQVLYPNIIAFDVHAFLAELGPEIARTCVEAYNDFLADFVATDLRRLVPLMMLPFWDVEASVREMERCRELGHRGILFAALFDRLGMPNIAHDSWTPLLSAAQDLELSINFHIGFGQREQGVERAELGQAHQAGVGGAHEPPVVRPQGRPPLRQLGPGRQRRDPRRRLPSLPKAEVRLGRERVRVLPLPAREPRLAVADVGRGRRIPRT